MLLSQDASGCVAFCCPPLQPAQTDGRNTSSSTAAIHGADGREEELASMPKCVSTSTMGCFLFDFHRFGWMLMHPALMLLKAALYVALSLCSPHFLLYRRTGT